ncbi:hypothetical protein DXG03_008087 [Asterophora parasitica]|uniref:RRM domain-containing protein n=1 Tax=Asterophora parasitica TaxID=117018 RepID=A0A9P7KCW7_9AGAR|nr:hypothetical protein DXG03_008087 [Asterophora parasitica]
MPPKPSLRMRSWGTRFDTLPTSPPVSPPVREAAAADAAPLHEMPEITPATDPPILKRREEKMPHDASVFVGSLPSSIDQHELTRMLSDHLSEHTEVKNIKVVRDSKGGVCAFVQCEDAASAATLIHTLHSSPPKQFLGRTLRYEPARAFRTLLISYRTPMQNVPGNQGNSAKPQAVELDLPFAMRLWRPWNSKFYSLLYNNDAVEAENYSRSDLSASTERTSLFLQPVVFDAETIGELAAYFGRLESIKPFQVSRTGGAIDSLTENADDDWKLYPAPHDAPRPYVLSYVAQALRRIPHLTVTWAHQPPPFGFEQRSPYTPFQHHNVANYPLHVQDPDRAFPQRDLHTDPFGFPRRDGNGAFIRRMRTLGNASSVASDAENESIDTDTEEGAGRRTANSVAGDGHPVKWSDMDFPPLGNAKGSMKPGSGVWSDRRVSSSQHTRSPSLGAYSATSDFPGVGHSSKDRGQELDMPPTPGLGRSPLTPKTPGFPATPTIGDEDIHAHRMSMRENFEGPEGGKDHGYYGDFASREQRDIDPMTLFVGGLETFGPGAWDEEKVTKFFSRFGGLEDVKIVRPLNSHAAFAFVKFNNTESPARAVFEEHNRIYEGRAMRVQLRDCNPPRGSWRNNRGRGRFGGQQTFGPHRRGQDHHDKAPERPDSRRSRRQDRQNQVTATAGQDEVHEQTEAQGDAEPPVYSEAIAPTPLEEPTEEVQAVNSYPEPITSPSSTPFTSLNLISLAPQEHSVEGILNRVDRVRRLKLRSGVRPGLEGIRITPRIIWGEITSVRFPPAMAAEGI